jgi:hypothetical protein
MKKIKTASFSKLSYGQTFSETLNINANDFMFEEMTHEDYIEVEVNGTFNPGFKDTWENPTETANYEIDNIIWLRASDGARLDITNEIMEYPGLSEKLVDLLGRAGAGETFEYND